MEQTTAGRVNWNKEEVEQVANRYLELRRNNPKMGEGAALKEAQKLLPEDRQRSNLCGLSQVPRIAKFIAAQQGINLTNPAEPSALASRKPEPDPKQLLDLLPVDELEQALRAKRPALFVPPTVGDFADDELVEAIAERRPDLLAAGSSTSTLIELVLGRFFHALSLERSRLEQAVTDKVVAYLNADRAKFEQRLFDIQSQIRGLVNRGIKDNAPASAPAPEDRNAYMPIFLLAGGDRPDFQRLQGQMMNASIRLQKIDVSKPHHVSIPTHDRIVIWTAKLTSDLQGSIRGKVNPQKLLVHTGTFDELGPLLVKEAKKIREMK